MTISVKRMGSREVLEGAEQLLPRVDGMEGLPSPEAALRKRAKRDGGDYGVVIRATTECFPQIWILIGIGVDNVSSGEYCLFPC